MSVCAVIVTYRTGPALALCLAALAKAGALDEIVIVDNGNPPEAERLLNSAAAGNTALRVLRGQGNIGFSAGCNLAARAAKSDTLAFINPDVILKPDAITRLVASLASAPPPAVVGGDLRNEAGQPERGSRRDRLTLWRAFTSFSGLSRLERLAPVLRDFNRHADPLPNAPVAVGAISGALFVMRREDFLRLGGFDENYFLHVEDLDLCRRAEFAGWRVLFAPGPHGVHVRSSSDADAQAIARHKAEGMARYFKKFARGPIEHLVAVAAGALLLSITPRRNSA